MKMKRRIIIFIILIITLMMMKQMNSFDFNYYWSFDNASSLSALFPMPCYTSSVFTNNSGVYKTPKLNGAGGLAASFSSKFGQAYSLDATTSSVNLGTLEALSGSSFSLSLWFVPSVTLSMTGNVTFATAGPVFFAPAAVPSTSSASTFIGASGGKLFCGVSVITSVSFYAIVTAMESTPGMAGLTPGVPIHIGVAFDGRSLFCIRNGTSVASTPYSNIKYAVSVPLNTSLVLGASLDGF